MAVKRHVTAMLLIAPLTLFLAIFFCWPLATILTQAVSDPAVSRALPATAAAMKGWDGASPPTARMNEALVEDLRAVSDEQVLGDLVRRLNGARAGFRTLMMRTVSSVSETSGRVDLVEVDPRWGLPEYWQTIVNLLPPYTDRYILAAVDLTRDASGSIVEIPADDSANAPILWRTFVVAATVTASCLFVGYPFAMLAISVTGWKRNLLMAAVLLPLITSLLVRTAAWYILLQDQGLINDFLRWAGITDTPLHLLFNRLGVIVAMTHILLPFMVLPIYSNLKSIPENLMPAAASLGADRFHAFRLVLLPLSLRGIASGSLLVFITAIGYYITPALIGGPKDQMISSVIAFYGAGSANWGMAGALSLVLLVITVALYAVYINVASDAEEHP